MAATYETSLAPQAVTFLAAGETEIIPFDAGSGPDRVLNVHVAWRERTNSISALTYNGVAMTAAGPKVTSGTLSCQLWTLANPASNTNDIAVVMGPTDGATSAGLISAHVVNGADVSGTPVSGYATGTGSGSAAGIVSSVPVDSAVGDRVVVFHSTINSTGNITATPSGYTERQEGATGGGISTELGDADGAASVTTDATWNNGAFAVSWVALGINVRQAAVASGIPVWLLAA